MHHYLDPGRHTTLLAHSPTKLSLLWWSMLLRNAHSRFNSIVVVSLQRQHPKPKSEKKVKMIIYNYMRNTRRTLFAPHTPAADPLHLAEFFIGELSPSKSCVLCRWCSSSSCFMFSTSSWLRKQGWFVEHSTLAHIRSVITTLFCFSVILCKILYKFQATCTSGVQEPTSIGQKVLDLHRMGCRHVCRWPGRRWSQCTPPWRHGGRCEPAGCSRRCRMRLIWQHGSCKSGRCIWELWGSGASSWNDPAWQRKDMNSVLECDNWSGTPLF